MKLRLTRAAALLLATTAFAVFGAACGDGYSEDDAKLYCDQEKVALGATCFTDGTYEQCLDCYEECGQSCSRQGGCDYQCVE